MVQPRPFHPSPVTAALCFMSMLHLAGYDLSLDELKTSAKWGSKTPGHPEFGLTPGVMFLPVLWAMALLWVLALLLPSYAGRKVQQT